MLPEVKEYKEVSPAENKLLILAEGFEARALSWLKVLDDTVLFKDVILCQYEPSKESRIDEVKFEVGKHANNSPTILKYMRFEPTVFEAELRRWLLHAEFYEDIYIDISVMSKMLIMIIINELKNYTKNLHIIYTEPKRWRPSRQQYDEAMRAKKRGNAICLSSVGVGDIVRTPALSSVVMQKYPVVLVAGLSFNEQIVNILVNDINPEKLFLINQGCPRENWRENAIEDIHRGIIVEYKHQKDMMRKYCLTEYNKVFDFLAEIYKRYWLTNRIIISPTGYKMHAVSFALLKICCPDIHIEYPTPDSYLFEGYSSDEVECIYELKFDRFKEYLQEIKGSYCLDG